MDRKGNQSDLMVVDFIINKLQNLYGGKKVAPEKTQECTGRKLFNILRVPILSTE